MSLINLKEQHQILSVRLNRPDVRNAFNPDMIAELTKIFSSLEKRKDLRAVTVAGEGKVFCAGADLAWMKEMVNYSFEQNREDSLGLFGMFEAMSRCSLPIVGMVHGAAIGGALGLMSCFDYIVAEEGSQFSFSEVKLGIAPAVISAFVRRKAVQGVVRPLMLSGRMFDVATAKTAGLVHEIVPSGAGFRAMNEFVDSLFEAGPEAVRETKKLLNDLNLLSWDEQRERTTRVIAERRVSSEGQEGLKSFLEKRAPAWRDA